MLAKSVLRNWQLDLLSKNLDSVHHIVESAAAESLTTYRDGGDGWTVTQVICHLRDYDAVFLERATLTMTQDKPPLPNPDPDEWAAERHYDQEMAVAAISAWRANRTKYLDYLKAIDDDAPWEREAKHPRRGLMSFGDQLMLTTWHDANHLEQITRILKEKKR